MTKRMNRRGNVEMYRVTPGVKIDNITKHIEYKKKSVAGVKSDDTKNREYVIKKILKNMSNGMTEDEALDVIMQDNIVLQFDYLKSNGCNLKECFKNWVKGYKKQKAREMEK